MVWLKDNAPPKKTCYHNNRAPQYHNNWYIFSSLPFGPGASQLISQTIHLNQIFSIVTLLKIRLWGPIGIWGALTRSQLDTIDQFVAAMHHFVNICSSSGNAAKWEAIGGLYIPIGTKKFPFSLYEVIGVLSHWNTIKPLWLFLFVQ